MQRRPNPPRKKRRVLCTAQAVVTMLVAAALAMSGCSGSGGTSSMGTTDTAPGTTAITTAVTAGADTQTAPQDTTGQSTDTPPDTPTRRPDTQPPGTNPQTQPPKTQPPVQGTTAATTKRDAPEVLLSDRKTSELQFGYYGLSPDRMEIDTNGLEMMQTDYVNFMFVGSGKADLMYSLPLCKKYKVNAWVYVTWIYEKVRQGIAGWEDDFDRLVQDAKDTGAYDALAGWYLDEPSDFEAMRKISKYAKEQYGKRFFVCFTVEAVCPEVYGSKEPGKQVTPETAAYLTDIAYDMYWDYSENVNRYELCNKMMKERTGLDDAYVWYIPNTYGGYEIGQDAELAKREESMRIEHLEGMCEMLKKEKKPGGILCFSYNFDSPSEGNGLYGMYNINRLTGGAWDRLFAETIRVGREICTGKFM